MKFVKLLTVPVVLLLSVVMAVPALAHTFDHGLIVNSCDTTAGQICLTLAGSIEPGFDKRTVTFQLYGVKGGTETLIKNSDGTADTVSFDLPANHGTAAVAFGAHKSCFKPVTTGNFDTFTVKVTSVTDTDTGQPADIDMTLTINEKGTTVKVVFPNDTGPVTIFTGISPCVASTTPTSPSPSPTNTGGNGGGSPSATANTTVVLAQTGGFDFRFPLIGLVLLVAGGTLFVVSASRRRSEDTK